MELTNEKQNTSTSQYSTVNEEMQIDTTLQEDILPQKPKNNSQDVHMSTPEENQRPLDEDRCWETAPPSGGKPP